MGMCRAHKHICELYPSREVTLCLDPYSGLGLLLWAMSGWDTSICTCCSTCTSQMPLSFLKQLSNVYSVLRMPYTTHYFLRPNGIIMAKDVTMYILLSDHFPLQSVCWSPHLLDQPVRPRAEPHPLVVRGQQQQRWESYDDLCWLSTALLFVHVCHSIMYCFYLYPVRTHVHTVRDTYVSYATIDICCRELGSSTESLKVDIMWRVHVNCMQYARDIHDVVVQN